MIGAAIVAVMTLTSCTPEAKAVSGLDVEVQIMPAIISSGFVQVEMNTNKESYYHIGIVRKEEAPDTANRASVRAFMNLKLDEAYTNYITWRHQLLEDNIPYIAEFPTHSLQYGHITYNFTFLEPGTDYMVYAFVVDAKTNKPDGRLFTSYVTTETETPFEPLQFEYRVRGTWDYVCPIYYYTMEEEEYYEVIDYAPWVGATVDSVEIRQSSFPTVLDYYQDKFGQYADSKAYDRIHFGIYAHNNDGYGDTYSDMEFEEGHTYYTAIALMDGYLNANAFYIYKFRWEGEQTQLYFKTDQVMQDEW